MKKRIIAFITVLVLLTSLSASAFAAQPAYEPASVTVSVSVSSYSIQDRILVKMVDSANKTIDRLIKVAQRTPYNDVKFLVYATELITAPVFAYAKLIGAKVVCEYVEYYIDGQYVEIDPLRVISF